MSIWALNNRDNVKEGNPILGDYPSKASMVSLKLLTIPIYQNFEQGQIVIMNYVMGAGIVNNLYVISRYD